MTRRSTLKKCVKLTPELLISHPRHSAGVGSPTGTHFIQTVSTYDLEAHSEAVEVRVVNVQTGESSLFSDNKDISNVSWLGVGTKIFWTTQSSDKETELWIGEGVGSKKAYLSGKIAAQIENIKTLPLDDGTIALAFSAAVGKDGKLFNTATTDKPLSSAREYESAKVRYWDMYYGPELSTLWFGALSSGDGAHGRYRLPTKFIDALASFEGGVEFPGVGSAQTTDGADYAIGKTGLAIVTDDPDVDTGKHTKHTIFYLPLKNFTEEDGVPIRVEHEGFHGSAVGGSFSPDGSHLLFRQQEHLDQEFNQRQLFITSTSDLTSASIKNANSPSKMIKLVDENGDSWDRALEAIFWANDMKTLYSLAEDQARTKLFKLTPKRHDDDTWSAVPTALTSHGSVSSAQMLSTSQDETTVFVAYTSLVESSGCAVIDTNSGNAHVIFSATQQGSLLDISTSQVSEFHAPASEGDGKYSIQSYVVKPSFFREDEKYPLMFLIHGGPQSMWSDNWSTRWNPAVFAEQGFIVVLPNPTGSTSFGFAYTNAVLGDWGGRCYRDLEQCYNYIEKHMPEVDLSRAIAAGASFGGYMANWIAGQPLGQKFQALVSHDGVFSHVNMYASDVFVTVGQDVGAELWDDPKVWDKFAPCTYTAAWNKPMLVIHSDNDYRCPITEGLAVYNVCQNKGISCRFLNFPDENHFVLKRENSLRWYKSVLGWSNYWAKNEQGTIELEDPVTRKGWKGTKKTIGHRSS